MQWSAASKKGPLYMPLKAFRLIENGRCPEATAEQALRVDRPPLVFSYTTSSASLPLKGRVRRTNRSAERALIHMLKIGFIHSPNRSAERPPASGRHQSAAPSGKSGLRRLVDGPNSC